MTPPTPVALLRHFERPIDRADQAARLLPEGRERAAALAHDLPPARWREGPLRVVCSPYRRCLESVADWVAGACAAGREVEVRVTADLAEHPREEDLDVSMARRDAEDLVDRRARLTFDLRPLPAGESDAMLRERCGRAARELRGRRDRSAVLVCSHQSTLCELAGHLGCEAPFERMGDMVRLELV